MLYRQLLLTCLPLSILAACGGSGGSGSSEPATGTASFAISDAPVEDLSKVVIEVDRISLKRVGADDIVVETFDSTDLGIVNADTFQIDLLDWQGVNQAVVIDNLVLPAGEYTDLRLKVLDQNKNFSYADRIIDGQRWPIKVPSGELKLGKFTVTADAVQTFTIEFDLRFSMTLAVGPDQYILKPRGVRIVKNEAAAMLSGTVDPDLFDGDPDCTSKPDPLAGNVIYLYEGHNLDPAKLADNFDATLSAAPVPAGTVAPYSSVEPYDSGSGWAYAFGYLPAGDYTLAFSCDAENDDPDNLERFETPVPPLSLPTPSDQVVEIALPVATDVRCNLPVVAGSCGS